MPVIQADLIFLGVIIGGAAILILFVAYNLSRAEINRLREQNDRASELATEFRRTMTAAEKEWQQRWAEAKKQKEQTEKRLETLTVMMNETADFYPSLAEAIADFYFLQSENEASYLKYKKHPAFRKAEFVLDAGRARRTAERELRQLKYQLLTYEGMFPWLPDISGRSTRDIIDEWKRLKDEPSNDTTEDAEEPERNWLTPDEYKSLTTAQKADKALERWQNSRRGPWEAGRDYERYVGYYLEQEGYAVSYQGAIEGLADMGRDLLAVKGDKVRIVQCKRWAKERVIHEKHIFQLIGTTLEYACLKKRVPIKEMNLA
jgi:hypothetical protein